MTKLKIFAFIGVHRRPSAVKKSSLTRRAFTSNESYDEIPPKVLAGMTGLKIFAFIGVHRRLLASIGG